MVDLSQNALNIPPQAQAGDPDITQEVLRLWWLGDSPAATLSRGFSDPRAWGVLLHAVAGYAAEMYASGEGGASMEQSLRMIEDHFVDTMNKHRQVRAQTP